MPAPLDEPLVVVALDEPPMIARLGAAHGLDGRRLIDVITAAYRLVASSASSSRATSCVSFRHVDGRSRVVVGEETQ